MSDTDKLETLNTESKIIYNYFVTNEYANKALNLLLDYLNTEYDFDDAIKQLAKEISDVVDGFTSKKYLHLKYLWAVWKSLLRWQSGMLWSIWISP